MKGKPIRVGRQNSLCGLPFHSAYRIGLGTTCKAFCVEVRSSPGDLRPYAGIRGGHHFGTKYKGPSLSGRRNELPRWGVGQRFTLRMGGRDYSRVQGGARIGAQLGWSVGGLKCAAVKDLHQQLLLRCTPPSFPSGSPDARPRRPLLSSASVRLYTQ